MNTALKILIGLTSILFIILGARWGIDPSGAAGQLGMPLLEGLGMSAQIGNVGAALLGMGIMILLGLTSQNPVWFYAPAILLSLVASFRSIAWLLHGAPFALQEIAIEIVLVVLLIIAAGRAKKLTSA
ncbi:MAG: hypothetical protein JKX81_03750 [Arenicella sp.]|nr:hypothetical protein [Arenicella sp.]